MLSMFNIYNEMLENYKRFVEKVDSICIKIEKSYGNYISCKKGCAKCCMAISLFPIEAVSISLAIQSLSKKEIKNIRNRVKKSKDNYTCPLIEDNICLLYDNRPIICRTHGLPILINQDGETKIDCCPLNFDGINNFPKDAIISLDNLNTIFVAINKVFVTEFSSIVNLPERIHIREAIFMEIKLSKE